MVQTFQNADFFNSETKINDYFDLINEDGLILNIMF